MLNLKAMPFNQALAETPELLVNGEWVANTKLAPASGPFYDWQVFGVETAEADIRIADDDVGSC